MTLRPAQSGFEERLRRNAGSGRSVEDQLLVELSERVGEGLAAKGFVDRHGIEVRVLVFVADDLADVAQFQVHARIDFALQGEGEIIGTVGPVVGIERFRIDRFRVCENGCG